MQFFDSDSKKRNNIRGIGALEHATSCSYVLSEDERILDILNEWVAHEYFHIVTPLNIHSNKIRPFHYNQNNPDSHLWLYAGEAVWASEILLLRDQQLSEQAYLELLAEKIAQAETFSLRYSLVDLSQSIFQQTSKDKFDYIDSNGSLAAFCLDVLMLSESNGRFGLRDMLVQLMSRFGRNNAFDDERLFDEIRVLADSVVAEFIGRHVIDNAPVDSQRCLALIGYTYDAINEEICLLPGPTEQQKTLRQMWLNT